MDMCLPNPRSTSPTNQLRLRAAFSGPQVSPPGNRVSPDSESSFGVGSHLYSSILHESTEAIHGHCHSDVIVDHALALTSKA